MNPPIPGRPDAVPVGQDIHGCVPVGWAQLQSAGDICPDRYAFWGGSGMGPGCAAGARGLPAPWPVWVAEPGRTKPRPEDLVTSGRVRRPDHDCPGAVVEEPRLSPVAFAQV